MYLVQAQRLRLRQVFTALRLESAVERGPIRPSISLALPRPLVGRQLHPQPVLRFMETFLTLSPTTIRIRLRTAIFQGLFRLVPLISRQFIDLQAPPCTR
jgi:hypothetical protein